MMKKINTLILACGILLALALPAQAAIVSVDYGDDGYFPELETSSFSYGDYWSNTTSATFELALPRIDDDTFRLSFGYSETSTYTNTVVDMFGAQFAAEITTGIMILKLEENVEIGPDSSWLFRTYGDYGPITQGTIYNGYSSVDAYWEDMAADESAYLGFTFTNTDNVACYGWMELNIDMDYGYVTIYGYAYDDAGSPILTGQTGSPVPLPGAVWLMGCGLIGLAGLRRH